MVAAILVAVIGVLGTIGGAIITVRLGRVQKSVNGDMDRLLDMIAERDTKIEQLLRERDGH